MLENKIKDLKEVVIPSKLRIMWFSNHPDIGTGFAKITREVLRELTKDSKFEIYCISEHYPGPPIQHDGYTLLGCKQPTNLYAQSIREHIERYQPHFLVCLEDSFTLGESNFNLQNMDFRPAKLVWYGPLDGGDPEGGKGGSIPSTGLKFIRRCDKIIAMAKFTQNELKKEGFDSDMIWHGVDTNIFKPVSKDEQNKLKVKYGFKTEDFVVFTYFRNAMRKRPYRHLDALAKFMKGKDNVKALFHVMNWRDMNSDLHDLIKRAIYNKHGVDLLQEDKIRFTPNNEHGNRQVTDNEIAEMIQMCDITYSCHSGEGFGLLMSESMACGKPTVTTGYTTPKELLIDGDPSPRGILAKYNELETGGLNTTHALVNTGDIANKMDIYYRNPELIEKHGNNGIEFVKKNLDWKVILPIWKEWFLKNV